MTLNGPKSSVNGNLKICDFLQTRIGFLDLFKGSLGKKREVKPEWKRGRDIETCFGSLSKEEDLRTKARASS